MSDETDRDDSPEHPDDDDLLEMMRSLARAPPVALEAMVRHAPGTVVGDDFEIIRELGAGGMGIVYLARDLRLDREVALKFVRPRVTGEGGVHEQLQAFEKEARATARLRHPNIVTLHDVGEHGTSIYLVLERLVGETLAERLSRGALSRNEALEVVVQVLTGLSHAHEHGTIHRDLKPANVFIERDGRVKILDFGLSGMKLSAPPSAGDGESHSVGGTPGYMAPEQWDGAPTDERTDVFAAGALLYTLLAGALPFGPADRPTGTPAKLSDPQLNAIVRRALAIDPDARTPDATHFLQTIRSFLRVRSRIKRGLLVGALAIAGVGGAALWTSEQLAFDAEALVKTWEPSAFGHERLVVRRLSAERFEIFGRDTIEIDEPQPHLSRFEAEVQRIDGEDRVFEGQIAEVGGWCCGRKGRIRLVALADREIEVTYAWAPRPGAPPRLDKVRYVPVDRPATSTATSAAELLLSPTNDVVPGSIWWSKEGRFRRALLRHPEQTHAFAGDFDGDGCDDLFWYAAGMAKDTIWWGSRPSRFIPHDTLTEKHPVMVTGEYGPIVGQFDGQFGDDIMWYQQSFVVHPTWWSRTTLRGYHVDVRMKMAPHLQSVAGDFDGNGTDDILFTPTGAGHAVFRFFSKDREYLDTVSTTALPPGEPLASADFDGDGAEDVLWGPVGDAPASIWWFGRGAQEVTSTSTRSLPVGREIHATVGDFDRDGTGDLMWALPDERRAVLFFGGTRRGWRRATEFEIGTNVVPVAGDFDGDGAADIFWARRAQP